MNVISIWVHTPFQLNDVGRVGDLLLFRPIQTFHCQIKLITNCASSLSFRIIASYWLSNTKRDLLGKKRPIQSCDVCYDEGPPDRRGWETFKSSFTKLFHKSLPDPILRKPIKLFHQFTKKEAYHSHIHSKCVIWTTSIVSYSYYSYFKSGKIRSLKQLVIMDLVMLNSYQSIIYLIQHGTKAVFWCRPR